MRKVLIVFAIIIGIIGIIGINYVQAANTTVENDDDTTE